jgi:hypothetical protein
LETGRRCRGVARGSSLKLSVKASCFFTTTTCETLRNPDLLRTTRCSPGGTSSRVTGVAPTSLPSKYTAAPGGRDSILTTARSGTRRRAIARASGLATLPAGIRLFDTAAWDACKVVSFFSKAVALLL